MPSAEGQGDLAAPLSVYPRGDLNRSLSAVDLFFEQCGLSHAAADRLKQGRDPHHRICPNIHGDALHGSAVTDHQGGSELSGPRCAHNAFSQGEPCDLKTFAFGTAQRHSLSWRKST
jgi:hypothetical protein